MAQGRCAGEGCGYEDTYKRALAHVGRCPAFAELYLSEPERALDPAEEYRRVAAERKPEVPARAPRPSRPEVSEAPARVSTPPRPRARKAPAGDAEPPRVAGPVNVEYWDVPDKLVS